MKRKAPRFCLADKYGTSLFVGDRIMWYSDAYIPGKGRIGRYISGKIIGFHQREETNWRQLTIGLVTKISVIADKKSYGKYDYGTKVSLSNLDNIIKLFPPTDVTSD